MRIKPFPEIGTIQPIAIAFPNFSYLLTANVYALGSGPVTLIDTGPKIPGFLDTIRSRLNLAGLDFSDVERIIITHGHMDHFGMAASICEAAGHPVACYIYPEDMWRLTSETFAETSDKEAEAFMSGIGIPDEEIEKFWKRTVFYKSLSDPLDDVSPMEDGDEFEGDGYRLRVIHTPGHSPGACCLYESVNKILFTGDHIIKHVTPNPLMEVKRNHLRNPDYRSLIAYMNSLDRLSGLDVRFVFPGHGEFMDDLHKTITSYRRHHQVRLDQVLSAIKGKARSPYSMIYDVFPELANENVFLAVSEILGHLEVLVENSTAKCVDAGPPSLYSAL